MSVQKRFGGLRRTTGMSGVQLYGAGIQKNVRLKLIWFCRVTLFLNLERDFLETMLSKSVGRVFIRSTWTTHNFRNLWRGFFDKKCKSIFFVGNGNYLLCKKKSKTTILWRINTFFRWHLLQIFSASFRRGLSIGKYQNIVLVINVTEMFDILCVLVLAFDKLIKISPTVPSV